MKYFYLITILHFSYWLNAQSLTGVWQGSLGNNQWLEINIEQKGNEICGYTYDTVIADNIENNFIINNSFYNNSFLNRDYCKTSFKGFVKNLDSIVIISDKTLEEGYSPHTKMRFVLKLIKNKKGNQLVGKCYGLSESFSTLSELIIGVADEVILEQISNKKPAVHPNMQPCFIVPKTPVIPKKQNEIIQNQKFDTIKPIKILKDTSNIKYQRSQEKEIKTIITASKTVIISIFDNAEIDGDIVSVFLNKQLMVDKEVLGINPIKLTIILNKENAEQILGIIAHNLGSIPPNTALCVIQAGTARYEIFSSVDLNTRANIKFKYIGN